MRRLAEIRDSDLNLPENSSKVLGKRKAVRAVLLNSDGEIALLFVSKNNYHKLPGGGMKKGEDLEKCLCREVLEETGCEIEILEAVGEVVERKEKQNKLQTSYCFIAEVSGCKKAASFTRGEISDGFRLKWVPLDEAYGIIVNDEPKDYMGRYVQKRDSAFLKKAIEIIKNRV